MHEERLVLFRDDRLLYRFAMGAPEPPRPDDETALASQIDALDPGRCHRLVFTGGSPLLHPAFGALARRARDRGIAELGLETDGAPLAAPGVAAELAAIGFRNVLLFLGGVRAKVHGRVLAQDDLRDALAGLRAAASTEGLRAYVALPLVRANVADAVPLLDWAREAAPGFAGLLLALPVVGEVPVQARRELLSAPLQAALAARVFTLCHERHKEYGFVDKRALSPCAAGGAMDRFGTVFHDRVTFFRRGSTEPLERVPACATCSLADACKGIEAEYVRTFGSRELRPVPLDSSLDWKLRPLNKLDKHEYKNVSPFRTTAETRSRSLLRINGHCNMSCSFCFVDRTAPDFAGDGLRANIDEMAAAGGKHLVLSGGEPTLHPELPRLLAHGKSLGFEVIEIQTNGVKCADRAYTEKLVEAGLTKATMSLHSHRPEHSDRITRLPNAFGKTIRAIHHFRELGVETQIAHVITKANYEDLPAFVRFLRSEFPRGGRGLSICFAIAQGISDLVYGWVVPTFTEVKPFFREALDFCLENELGFGGMIGQGGYPPCMLDGDLRYYRENLRNVFVSDDWDSQFHKSPRCRECSFDPYCVGPRKSYVETYGDGEIRPFEASIEGAVPLPAPKLVTLRRKDGGADAPATGDG